MLDDDLMNNNKSLTIIYGKKSLKHDNTIFVNEEDFQIPIAESSEIPLKEINRLQKLLFRDKPIPELFIYENFSLWWYLHPSICPQIKKTINFTIKFLQFVEKLKPNTVKIEDDYSTFNLIKQICNKKNIILEYSKLGLAKFKAVQSITRIIQKFRYKKITNAKIKNRKKLFFARNNSIPDISNKIVFAIPTLYRRRFLNPKTGNSEEGEYIQQGIMDLIEKKYSIIGIDLDYTFKGNIQTLSERLKSKMSWFPLEILLQKNNSKHKKHKEFLTKYKNVISHNEFQKLFNFSGISLWEQVEDVFIRLSYTPYLPFYLDLIDLLLFLFNTQKPKAIFLPYETGPLALSFIIAAKRFKIKTIGIAHAIIDKRDPGYSYDRLQSDEDPYGFPLPDITLLLGKFSKQTLLQKNYPSERFVVFGNPVFFNLNKIKELLDEKTLQKKYEINENQKVILFTTEYLQEYYTAQGKYNYDTQIWEKLLENFAGKNEFLLILKPHPSENTTIYEKMLKKFPTTNVFIKQGDLLEMIQISSVVISIYSTTMLDAICMNKPVLRVTFDSGKHGIPYDKFGVVISTSLDKLEDTIYSMFENNQSKNNLEKNRTVFLKEQYNIPEDSPELILKKILD